MLNGVCPEAIQVLIDKPVTPQVFSILRKMKAIRQIEAAEHMVAGGTYTIPFAKALLAASAKPEMLEKRTTFIKTARSHIQRSKINVEGRK